MTTHNQSYESYSATYCESCGRFETASDTILERCEEPVHRVDILEALGDWDEVGETVAEELGECEGCGGQLVKRWYVTGDPPDAGDIVPDDYEPPENVRSPDEDALLFDADGENPKEVRELSWIEAEDDVEE